MRGSHPRIPSIDPMRKLLLALLLALGLGAATAQDGAAADTNVTGDPGATVIDLGEGESITAEEFEQEFDRAMRSLAAQQGVPYTDQTRELFDRFRGDFLNELATREALLREAEARGIEVTDQEVEDQLAQARESAGGQEAFDEALRGFGYESEDEFRTSVQEGLTAQRVIDEYRSEVEVSDEEVQGFYEENQDQFGEVSIDEVRPQIENQLVSERLGEQFTDLREQYGIETFPERVATEGDGAMGQDLEPTEPADGAAPEGDMGNGDADGAQDGAQESGAQDSNAQQDGADDGVQDDDTNDGAQ